ncbi:hypothetical protein P5673_010858 [Acropora cervicornis]|uniref:Uncharacterized protein n=1 Tax=Acropora cervicornis TaxID=6130 RepID=A0AAD9QRA5_ACRCE|nr:hypothetical protein P5673_010858 [Acropora cervicornis]
MTSKSVNAADPCTSSEIRGGELEDKSDGATKRTTDVKSEMHASEERDCIPSTQDRDDVGPDSTAISNKFN